MRTTTPKRACWDLIEVLRTAGLWAFSVGHCKGVLYVSVDNAERDGPKVPQEFDGYAVKVHQDPSPAPPRVHKKIGDGCAHSRWEITQFKQQGIVPNVGCREPASQGALRLV